MRALGVPFLLTTIGWLGGELAVAGEPPGSNPLLERSEDVEHALGAYDFGVVRVFTWRGGLLEGKVNFVEGGAIKPVDLSAVVLNAARKLLRDGESLDPKTISGVIVIAIKKSAGDAAKGRECHVSIAVRQDVVGDGGKGTKVQRTSRISSVINGLVPEAGEAWVADNVTAKGVRYDASESLIFKGGKQFKLYELKLSARSAGTDKEKKGEVTARPEQTAAAEVGAIAANSGLRYQAPNAAALGRSAGACTAAGRRRRA